MKSNKLFIVWGVIVMVLIGLLTYLGFFINKVDRDYKEVEDALKMAAEGYVDVKSLYPKEDQVFKVTLDVLRSEGVLEKLEHEGDTCDGYVEVKLLEVYKFTPYIKCGKYTTKGYK